MRLTYCGARWFVIAAAVILTMTTTLQAALVTYTLEIQPNAGTWQLFGEASLGDNGGLAGVAVPLVNVDFPVDLQLPEGRLIQDPGIDVGTEAFFVNRDPMSPVGGAQDTIGGMGIVYGFGQTSGMLSIGNTFVQQNYDAKLLIAQGTFDKQGPLPSFGAIGASNVFMDNTGAATMDANPNYVVAIPEPSSCLLMIAGAAVTFAGRRLRRVGPGAGRRLSR